MAQVIWLRVGDEDGYHEFDGIEDAAEYLALSGVRKIERHCQYGVSADGYEGRNYISAYWGSPDNADATRDLTDTEIEEVNLSLESCADSGYFD